ncbi:NAD(P)H-binding protein [Tardiphaga sp. P9-11]|uniref:NmrA family NAD(P)-binding protein n=1 Tax=Tardiphaga sp. P9-11 TaxID=2024614 RepID=UPI0011F2851C|nr:NAD(P)H-binding protein [Tardiphaga sp. P9-11]KAA0069982.1 hydroxylase [Tardiphaga sp. P9-11]
MNTHAYDLPILVTGAAGRIGSVGRTVTDLLLRGGFKVRAHVRVDDDRAASLRDLGAEVVVGDLLDLMAVHRAMEGCERICFTMAVSPSYLEAATNVAVVAKHHQVKAFVNLSQMTVKEMDIFNTTASPQQKQHWLAEQILTWSGLPVVEVRPTAFMEGLFLQSTKTVSLQDKIMAPFGTGKNSAIAAVDVARTIAAILSDPAAHIGKTYHLTGPVSQDMKAVAREFSEALGRTISFVDVPLEAMKQQLTTFGMPPHVISHVATMAQLHQDNRYDRHSDDVERLTGISPMSVKEFVKRNAAAFAAPLPSS